MYLEVYSLNDKLIERKSFIYLDTIINHLTVKLSNIAIIHGSKRKINNDIYFRYYKFEGYTLKKEKFLKLLENSKIFATLESRVGKSGINDGKYKNKNLVFKINREYLEELFEKRCYIDNDQNISKLEVNKKSNFYIMR